MTYKETEGKYIKEEDHQPQSQHKEEEEDAGEL